jgi:hypothetical protein
VGGKGDELKKEKKKLCTRNKVNTRNGEVKLSIGKDQWRG